MKAAVRTLLAEDSLSDAELVLASLAGLGQAEHTHVARDGVEALDFLFCRAGFAARASAPPVRLVLLDLKLPKIDGLEVLREIKGNAATRHLPVVMLTSSNIETDVLQAYALGANSYVQKPVDFSRFRDVIQQIGRYWHTVNEPPPGGPTRSGRS